MIETFRLRTTELDNKLDAITCAMKTLAIQAKFKTGTLLFAETLRSKISTETIEYSPQRVFASAQSQLSRLNR